MPHPPDERAGDSSSEADVWAEPRPVNRRLQPGEGPSSRPLGDDNDDGPPEHGPSSEEEDDAPAAAAAAAAAGGAAPGQQGRLSKAEQQRGIDLLTRLVTEAAQAAKRRPAANPRRSPGNQRRTSGAGISVRQQRAASGDRAVIDMMVKMEASLLKLQTATEASMAANRINRLAPGAR